MNSMKLWMGALAVFGMVGCGAGGKEPQPGLDLGDENSELSGKDDSATSPYSTVAIAFGEIKTASFTSAANYRGFKFAGTAGQKIDAYLDGLKGLDTVLYLYKVSKTTGRPYGKPIAMNDDTATPGWTVKTNTTPNEFSSDIPDFVLPETRSYALIATTYRQWYTGKAEIVVKTPDVTPTKQQCSGFIAYPPCPAGQYCEISVAQACKGADLPGYCEPIPQACTEQYAPVCGCDGKTYSNDCHRKGAQAQLDHQGTCGVEGDPCGTEWKCQTGLTCVDGNCKKGQGVGKTCAGIASLKCADGLVCVFAAYTCGMPDAGGTCQMPIVGLSCAPPNPDIDNRVCGCDGKTWIDSCHARAANVSIASMGPCEEPCKVVCKTDTAGEGWYDCRNQLKKAETCAGCQAYCGAIGSRSEGWYSTCSGLITWLFCSKSTNHCTSVGGICAPVTANACPKGWTGVPDTACGQPKGTQCCMPPK